MDNPSQATSEVLPVLDALRLQLRGWQAEDLPAYFALYSDPRVMRYWSFAPYRNPDEARPRFERDLAAREPGQALAWAITLRGTGRVVGAATLFGIDAGQGRAQLGYALASAHWRQGYAREAVSTVLGHAFGRLALRRVEADTDPRNLASCRLLQCLGFQREGLLRERWQVDGEVQDTALYGLLARDWRAAIRG